MAVRAGLGAEKVVVAHLSTTVTVKVASFLTSEPVRKFVIDARYTIL